MNMGDADTMALKKLEWLMDMQKNEVQLHWTRNNYFIVTEHSAPCPESAEGRRPGRYNFNCRNLVRGRVVRHPR